MTLVPLVDPADADPRDRPVLEAGRAAYGQILNTWAAIANVPGLFAAYLPFLRGVAGPGALDTRVKELTAVRVAVLNHCTYTTSHRCASARKQGVSDADLGAVAAGDFAGFEDRLRAALELTDTVTLRQPSTSVAASESGVDTELLTWVAELFPPAELVELVMSIGVWNALTRFHRVMGFDADMPAPPDSVTAAL